MISIDESDAKCILDALDNALSASSGYLDTDECVAVRNLAKALGVDPMTVTPPTFVGQYTHVPRLEAYTPHMYVNRGAPLLPGWRWVERYDRDSAPGDRWAGRATRDPVQRCAICATAVGHTTAGADHPLHRPWVDEYDLEALAQRCARCGVAPRVHDDRRRHNAPCRGYVDESVYFER